MLFVKGVNPVFPLVDAYSPLGYTMPIFFLLYGRKTQ